MTRRCARVFTVVVIIAALVVVSCARTPKTGPVPTPEPTPTLEKPAYDEPEPAQVRERYHAWYRGRNLQKGFDALRGLDLSL